MAKLKPDPGKLYRPIEPFATLDGTVLNPSAKLRGDDPIVAEHFALFIPADAADGEVQAARMRTKAEAEQSIRADRARQRAANPPPEPGTVMIAVVDHAAGGRTWQRGDRLISYHPAVRERPDAWRPLDEVLPPEPGT